LFTAALATAVGVLAGAGALVVFGAALPDASFFAVAWAGAVDADGAAGVASEVVAAACGEEIDELVDAAVDEATGADGTAAVAISAGSAAACWSWGIALRAGGRSAAHPVTSSRQKNEKNEKNVPQRMPENPYCRLRHFSKISFMGFSPWVGLKWRPQCLWTTIVLQDRDCNHADANAYTSARRFGNGSPMQLADL
jgi:hypothetical protein